MKKPIIGISASMIFEEKDELFLGDKYSCVAHSYVDAIYKSGGIPVVLPILKDELVKMFKNIGFSNIEIFGDFKKSEWSKESYNTVIKAWK